MLVGITTKLVSEYRGIGTWRYDLECPESDENDPNAFWGGFWIDVRIEDEEGYFDWDGIDFEKSSYNFETMKLWIYNHHEELENAINRGYVETEID
jgi:hypothetical protein